jgi:predicted nucleotidyltransferase
MEVPKSIDRIIQRGISELGPMRILLFGSRARGDAKPRSDFDLAFQGVQDDSAWTRFASEMCTDAPTLYGLDIVRYEHIPPELRANIDKDGVVLYEAC